MRIHLAGCEDFWFGESSTSARGEIELVGMRVAAVHADVDLGFAGWARCLPVPLDEEVQQVIDVRVDATYGTGAITSDLAH